MSVEYKADNKVSNEPEHLDSPIYDFKHLMLICTTFKGHVVNHVSFRCLSSGLVQLYTLCRAPVHRRAALWKQAVFGVPRPFSLRILG